MANEALNQLRQVTLLRELPDDTLQVLLQRARRVPFQPGQVLFRQGEPGATMLVLLDGRLRVTLVDANGRENEIGAIAPGHVVGEMATLDPAPRAATVTSVTAGEVLELNAETLRDLRKAAPPVAAALTAGIINDVTQRLRKVNERIESELDPDAAKAKKAADAGATLTANAQQAAKSQPGGLAKLWAKLRGR